ncbi:MAG: wax ester/triacylglycerol synthase family O-acyltransferase [Deltaproteobacteria bacterium]|nr:wax ester/triacylglycerol synthase family O-acyltransferase [Deltaproteobacteria bacterium]
MTPWSERLGALDALFLDLEDRSAHMHVGALTLFEGTPPPYRDFLKLIESKLPYVPRYRQRLMFVPFSQGRPVWIDESDFDLEFHVRHTALPSPGGLAELKKLAGRLLSQRLDRDKPLWEMWLVEGLAQGGFAIVSKSHHCMIDGVSGVDLAAILLDPEASDAPPPPPEPWNPRPAPTVAELLVTSMKEQIAHPLKFAKEAIEGSSGGSVGDARKLLKDLVSNVKPLLGLAQMGLAPPTSLNVPIGPHRKFECVDFSLSEVKQVRAGLGGTVNDVILASVAGALRTFLTRRGETLGPDLRVMVPVSVRPESQHGALGNQVSAMFCPLPVADADPASRLRKVREAMKGLKESGQVMGAQALSRLGDFAPPTILAQAARLQSVTRMFNVVVTNVPGPQFPLYLLGRRMKAAYPQVPLAAMQAVGVALLSYDGNIGVGLLGDADQAKDLPELAHDLRAAMNELLAAAGAHVTVELSQPAPKITIPEPASPPQTASATPPAGTNSNGTAH